MFLLVGLFFISFFLEIPNHVQFFQPVFSLLIKVYVCVLKCYAYAHILKLTIWCVFFLIVIQIVYCPESLRRRKLFQGVKPEIKVGPDGKRFEDYWGAAKKVCT